jgi:hypothetical protein
MQEQAQTAASNLSAGPEAFQQNMSSYMSPYMQNVVDIQKQEAARQSGIMGTQQQAQAAQAGAFGGGRDAIMRAERERNLGQQMNQIQAQGSQAAYDQAANQFRQGITQDVAINQLQNQYGGQQQAQAQKGLDVGYQDFLNQQNYPYKQIGFMSDLVRGLPLGQQSTAQMYQAPPSTIQTVGALGMGAYGASQLMGRAEGGQVKSYAGGGEINPMNDMDKMVDAVDKLTDEQLQQIIQNPTSAAQLQAAQLELATRASERSGLAGAYNMAQGGVVAFDEGGEADDDGFVPNATGLNVLENEMGMVEDGTTGNFNLQQQLGLRFLRDYDANKARKGVALRSDKEMEDATLARLTKLGNTIGGDQMYTDIESQLTKMRGENEGSLQEGRGLAALQAAGAMLQGNDPIRGIGAAGSAFASSYAPALAAKRKADQAFTEMNINLSKARRAEKMGLLKEANEYEQNAEKNKIDAFKADTAARKMGLDALPPAMTAVRPAAARAGVKDSDMVIFANSPPEMQERMIKFLQAKGETGLAGVLAGIASRTAIADQGNVIDWAAQIEDFTTKAQKVIGDRRDGDKALRQRMRDDPTLESKLVDEEVKKMIRQAQGTAASTKIGGSGGKPVIKLD